MAGKILRIATAGSVDNGKSTLIGRLLYDSKSIFEDQLSAVERTSIRKGNTDLDLSLFTDGLREEVELGITIDVAYRYFSTPIRKFIIADTPGHSEFTRNMITGASTTDLIIILIDVMLGITEQTKRHSFIAGLLGLSNIIVCVNKMDLKNWDEEAYNAIVGEYQILSKSFNLKNVEFVPISALKGDNVVNGSRHMDWYKSEPLLGLLEMLPQNKMISNQSLRCLVQCKLGKDESSFYYGVKVLQGELKIDTVLEVYPSKRTVSALKLMGGYEDCKLLMESVAGKIVLSDDSLKRGDILTSGGSVPTLNDTMGAMICWLSTDPFVVTKKLVLQHVSGEYIVSTAKIQFAIDMKSMEKVEEVNQLKANDIASLLINLDREMPFDPYENSREMGSFILIDPVSNATVAAGMIR
ncbi:MAG: sulfate adenylyltransferase subunit 1 [Crocinitomicaceae bacterium]|jgi:sulfate adenylyltransferase subunit 1